ncbi:hypothetical protein Hanom_Chr10g00967141 [Helianthus anomalus]
MGIIHTYPMYLVFSYLLQTCMKCILIYFYSSRSNLVGYFFSIAGLTCELVTKSLMSNFNYTNGWHGNEMRTHTSKMFSLLYIIIIYI